LEGRFIQDQDLNGFFQVSFNKGTIIRQLFRKDNRNKGLVAGDFGYIQVKTPLHFKIRKAPKQDIPTYFD